MGAGLLQEVERKENTMIHTYIKQLVEYGIDNGLLEPCDRIYTTNILLDMLKMDAYEDPGEVKNRNAL